MLTAHRSKRQSVDGTWEADKDAKNCAVCEAKFSMTKLKYHCRMCGKVVCNACSKNREHLPGVSRSGQVKRVCDSCVDRAKEAMEKAAAQADSDADDVTLVAKDKDEVIADSLENAGF